MAGQWQQQCRRMAVKTTWQDNLPCAGFERAMSAPEACETNGNLAVKQPRNILQEDSSETRRHVFNHPVQKIMNTSPTSPTTPDLESLRKAIQEYQPDPSRIPFSNLKPFHDSIVELRGKNASYAAIADLLMQNGIKTSRARVAEYGRIILEGGKSRKRRKRARTAPAANIPATPQSAPAVATKPTPPKEDSPDRSRGPHIANVRMMSPQEAKEFNDSLKPKPPAS